MHLPRTGSWIATSSFGLMLVAASCTTFTSEVQPADGGMGSGADAALGETSLPQPDAERPADGVTTDGGDPDAAAWTKLMVFVTSLGYGITTAAQADTICAAEANGRLPGTFRAWYPSFDQAAPERIFGTVSQARGPWFRPDLVEVAATELAFVKTAMVPLLAPISVTATLETRNGGAWTGTRSDGGRGVVCPQASPTKGSTMKTNGAWTNDEPGSFTATCGASLFLYCFQVP